MTVTNLKYELIESIAPLLESRLHWRDGSVLAMPDRGAGLLYIDFYRQEMPEIYEDLKRSSKWFFSSLEARRHQGYRLLMEPNFFYERGGLRMPDPKDDSVVTLVTHRGGPLFYSVVHTQGRLGALSFSKQQVTQAIIPAFFPKAEVVDKDDHFSQPLPKVGPWID